MKQKNGFPKESAKIYKNGTMTQMYTSTRIKRLYTRIRGGNYDRIYIRVNYGMAKTKKGKLEMFYNDGNYTDHKEAYKALRAFLE